jgi:hypothetical protein
MEMCVRKYKRQLEKRRLQLELVMDHKCGAIVIKIPNEFHWPFPMWPMNKDRPFRKERERTSDMPRC